MSMTPPSSRIRRTGPRVPAELDEAVIRALVNRVIALAREDDIWRPFQTSTGTPGYDHGFLKLDAA
ncbi:MULTISPECIES: hypothetical protein [unclassified Chelatococcus]|uniref:hypothetical protein n=1 Tax=unclassified Chelatococcus TaxID=2638111 RepID=UPI001BD13C2B|nr:MULTISPECIES: hypothetical protein [unclassified Chelatococcus]MBS7743671.1 hypothetical protein [Chelatococcus sp. HY11]MBX3546426.1 hypothetical protein [Chelatococcus sp.]MCO5079734.1 hypothetical protein [Chelatococcus sp.]